jgi:hypothetical protein
MYDNNRIVFILILEPFKKINQSFESFHKKLIPRLLSHKVHTKVDESHTHPFFLKYLFLIC